MNEPEYLDQEDQEKAVEIRVEDVIYRSDESPAMVRKPRGEFRGALFMMARSNRRTILFHAEADHHAYLVCI